MEYIQNSRVLSNEEDKHYSSNESEYWEQQKNPTNSIQFSTCGNNESKFRTTYIILADELLLAGVDGLMMSSVKLTGLDE